MIPVSPSLLAELRAAFAPTSSGYLNTIVRRDGIVYQSNGSAGWGMDGNGAVAATGFYAYRADRSQPGDPFSMYLLDGTYLGEGTFREAGNGLDLLALAVASAVGMYFLLPAAGGAAAVGGAPATMTAAGTVAGDAYLPGILGAGGSEVAWGAVIPGFEASVVPLATAGAAAATAGSAVSTAGTAAAIAKTAGALVPLAATLGGGSNPPPLTPTPGSPPPARAPAGSNDLVLWLGLGAAALMFLS